MNATALRALRGAGGPPTRHVVKQRQCRFWCGTIPTLPSAKGDRAKMKSAAFLLAAAAVIPSAAVAGPWYVGIGLGQSSTSTDLVTNRESTIVNAADIRSDFDRNDTA